MTDRAKHTVVREKGGVQENRQERSTVSYSRWCHLCCKTSLEGYLYATNSGSCSTNC